VMALCRAAGFRPEVAQQVRESSTIVGLVAAGVGVAIVPRDTRFIQLEGVVYKSLLDPAATSALHLAHRGDNHDPHVANLARMLRKGGGGHFPKIKSGR
jgi:DNA-binding transcriptional LysR family regulator